MRTNNSIVRLHRIPLPPSNLLKPETRPQSFSKCCFPINHSDFSRIEKQKLIIEAEENEEGMRGMWKNIREKLGFIRKSPTTGCCGALWGSKRFSPPIDPVTLGNADDVIEEIATTESAVETNLAAALAEEQMERTSLMNWLEEEEEEEGKREAVGLGESCCVCMEKKKGAAFIPCGHAFCRVCARDIWIERRSCALCNRPILEILHIY